MLASSCNILEMFFLQGPKNSIFGCNKNDVAEEECIFPYKRQINTSRGLVEITEELWELKDAPFLISYRK